MQLPPIEVIEAWPIPNYAHPEEVRGPTILVVTMIMVPILVILVILRLYTRIFVSRNLGADDFAIVASVFPCICCTVLALIAVFHLGWSVHVWDVPQDQLVMGLKFVIVIDIMFVAGTLLTKVSMLLLVMRIMASGSIILKRTAMALLMIVVVDFVIYLIVIMNTCHPISEYWTLSFAPQNCFNESAHILAGGIINTVTDFCVVLIPIPVVFKLQLPLRQRIACAMLFGAGFIVCFAAIVRMYFQWQLNTTWDKTWLAYPTWIAATIELYLGVIVTSIPAIKPLLTRYFPKLLSSVSKSNSYTKSSTTSNTISVRMDTLIESSSRADDHERAKNVLTQPNRRTIATTASPTLSKPLVFCSPISDNPTYQPESHPSYGHPESSQTHTLWTEAESSKTSLSSFGLERQSLGEEGGLAAPNTHRRVESREILVAKPI